MTSVSHVDGGKPHPAPTYTIAALLHVTVHERDVFSCMFRGSDPVESRGRLRSQLEDLPAGGGRVTGRKARGHQMGQLQNKWSKKLGNRIPDSCIDTICDTILNGSNYIIRERRGLKDSEIIQRTTEFWKCLGQCFGQLALDLSPELSSSSEYYNIILDHSSARHGLSYSELAASQM